MDLDSILCQNIWHCLKYWHGVLGLFQLYIQYQQTNCHELCKGCQRKSKYIFDIKYPGTKLPWVIDPSLIREGDYPIWV